MNNIEEHFDPLIQEHINNIRRAHNFKLKCLSEQIRIQNELIKELVIENNKLNTNLEKYLVKNIINA